MSILSAASDSGASQLFVAFALAIPSVLLMWMIGVFEKRSIHGPVRLSPGTRAMRLAFNAAIGILLWIGVQGAYAMTLRRDGEAFDSSKLSPGNMAFLSTVPGLVLIGTLLVAARATSPDTLPHLGLTRRNSLSGFVRGLLAMFIIMPLILSVSLAAVTIYDLLGIEHPSEHEVLHAIKQAPQFARILLIVGATVIAPVAEELLFRGHLQTLLRQATRSPWIAVIVTSLMFAGIHPAWTIPPIFALSLCLGYAYERTGNLYLVIFIHALFNTIQTVASNYFPTDKTTTAWMGWM